MLVHFCSTFFAVELDAYHGARQVVDKFFLLSRTNLVLDEIGQWIILDRSELSWSYSIKSKKVSDETLKKKINLEDAVKITWKEVFIFLNFFENKEESRMFLSLSSLKSPT